MNEETNTLLRDILSAQQELFSAYREESRRAEEFRNYIIEHDNKALDNSKAINRLAKVLTCGFIFLVFYIIVQTL